MSKVASYLQGHISGEVTTNPGILAAMSHDMSVLEMMPEMVVYPRTTNDIRKVARFSWQLAEKGHTLSLTARGAGSDQTGGAIGKGMIIATQAHMRSIFEFDTKQKLIRLQPGVSIDGLTNALQLQGMGVPALVSLPPYGTVGGAISKNLNGPFAGRYGSVGNWVSQLEVVLANGDVLQTERLSKRDVSRKKGKQTLEGEIYRSLDSLIDDNAQLIAERVGADVHDTTGYAALASVKHKDGSIDLTPLFIGAQGTLGIISEMIIKTEFVGLGRAVLAAAFPSVQVARDAIDLLDGAEPACLEYYDGELFNIAAEHGKSYTFVRNAGGEASVVVMAVFDDFSERTRQKKLKKAQKMLAKLQEVYVEDGDGEDAKELLAMAEVTAFAAMPDIKTASAPSIVDGAFVPRAGSEEFMAATRELAAKHGVRLPMHVRMTDNTYYARPTLHLHKVSDKQKVFRLLDEYSKLVERFGGHLIGNGGEGRVKARFAYASLDPEVTKLYESVKAIFDPYGILNPDVKQSTEVRNLVSHLRSEYDTAQAAGFVQHN